jgi:hypothetical protein
VSRVEWGVSKPRQARARSWSTALRDQSGYAAIDALVGLMMLAAVLVCAVSATHQSREAAGLALEFRHANELAGYLLETAPAAPGVTHGQAVDFAWTRTVSEPSDTFGAGAICERRVTIVGLRDNRRFEARTNSVCPAAQES